MNELAITTPKRFRPKANVVIGAGLVVIGLLATLGSFRIAPDYDGSTTARIFPLMTSAAITLLGVLTLRAPAIVAPAPEGAPGAARRWHPLAILALAVVYLWLMGKFGYLLPTALAAPTALWLFGIRNAMGLAVAAVVCPLAYHAIFFELLGAFPPFGAWFDPLDLLGN